METVRLSFFYVLMPLLVLLLGGCLGGPQGGALDADGVRFIIQDGDTVVFYGDGVSDVQWSPMFIRTYIATRYPEWRNTFINRVVGGDEAISIKRFERDVVDQKPDVAFFMICGDDKGNGKLSSKRVKTFLGNVEESVCMLRIKSPKTKLVLASSSLKGNSTFRRSCENSSKSCSCNLLMLSRAEKELAGKLDVPFFDVGKRCGNLVCLDDLSQKALTLSSDALHLQEQRGLSVAVFMLEEMHADGNLASVFLEAIEAVSKKSEKCEVRAVNWSCEGEFVFERCCDSLPFAVSATSATSATSAFLAEINDKLNRDILQVVNLDSKAFELIIDGRFIALLREDEFAKGINLSKYDTPMRRQALKVFAAARKLDKLKNEIFLLIRQKQLDGFGRVTKDTPPDLKAKLPAMNKAIESAKLALYSLNKPVWHKFMLRPSKKIPKRVCE
jgi:hypothetical protein